MTRCEYLNAYHYGLEKVLSHWEDSDDYQKWPERYFCFYPVIGCPFIDDYIRECPIKEIRGSASKANENGN